jgi:cellulose synthase/poly-beta-1,6-N-acetylglucosamine synthase-like glycosyltransferase
MDLAFIIQIAAMSVVIVSILFYTYLLISVLFPLSPRRKKVGYPAAYRKVAIFVAARDEEFSLPDCLASLAELDYPKEFLDIHVADDNSNDSTAEVIHCWIDGQPNRYGYFLKQEPEDGVNGKARALSRMTKGANAELYLFTDADCKVPRTWVKSMVAAYEEKHGMVLGVTKVVGEGRFSRLQAMDWMLHQGVIKQLADRGYSLTAMGNNMLVGAKPLAIVGGFANVENSITEDLSLCRLLYDKGYRPEHLVGKENLVQTKAESGWPALLRQRKRWAEGAMGLPLVWKLILFIQVAFFPAIIMVMIHYSVAGVLLWVLKFSLQSIFLSKFARQSETIFMKIDLLIFEWYYFLSTCAAAIYYFWPSRVKWKKRAY